jgi:hypothetical protein
MKKLVVILVALGLTFGASAQSKRSGGVGPVPGKKVVIIRSYPPFSPFYGYGRPYYGYPPFRYSPFYSPFGFGFDNAYRYQNRPTKLDLRIEDIKNEYQDRIASVRQSDELSRKEKRQKVQELKNSRDKEINETRKNYYKSDSRA